MPPEVITTLTSLGLPGVIILLLIWALIRKDKQVEALQEARVADQKERAADNLRSAAVVEQLNAAARAREEASDSRGRVLDTLSQAVHATAEAVKSQSNEINRIGRLVENNALRLGSK